MYMKYILSEERLKKVIAWHKNRERTTNKRYKLQRLARCVQCGRVLRSTQSKMKKVCVWCEIDKINRERRDEL